jgi:uncharacterized protein YndB with AHSA1/START domain
MTDIAVDDAIVYEIYVATKPERVFEALVNADQVPQWWGDCNGVSRLAEHVELAAGFPGKGRDGQFAHVAIAAIGS